MTRKPRQRRNAVAHRTYPDGLDFSLSVLILFLLLSLASQAYVEYPLRAKLINVFASLAGLRVDLGEWYAIHGEWTTLGSVPPFGDAVIGQNVIARASVEQGTITYRFDDCNGLLGGHSLTLRPMMPLGDPTATVSWLCGYAALPRAFASVSINHTDIQPTLLPALCRL